MAARPLSLTPPIVLPASMVGAVDSLPGLRRLPSGPGQPPFGWPSDDLAFLTEILRAQHVPGDLIKKLALRAASSRRIKPSDQLKAALAAELRFISLAELLRKAALLLVGPTGAGNTTLAAKLAARLDPRQVVAINTDTARPFSAAQLEDYVRVLGVKLTVAGSPEELRGAVAGNRRRTLIIDTAGAAPYDTAAAARLRAFKDASGAELVLVLPADLSASEAEDTAGWAAGLGAGTIIVTRLDLTRRAGALLAAAAVDGLTLAGASVSPHFAYGLKDVTPELLARQLLAGTLDEGRGQTA